MSYTLAKDLVLIRVRADPATAQILVCASAPTPTEDAKFQYAMAWKNNPFAADKIKIEKHFNTNILKSIEIESLDQTDRFVFELAKSAGSIVALTKERTLATTDCEKIDLLTLVNIFMDPGDPDDTREKVANLNQFVMSFVSRHAEKCNDRKSAQSQTLPRAACEEYLRIHNDYKGRGQLPIELRWTRPSVPAGHRRPDCSVGICYRALLPYMLYISVAGAAPVSHPFAMPNNSPVIAMDVSRGIAITKTTRIGFSEHGQPTTFFIQKGDDNGAYGAEAVELAKLPVTVVNAYFGSMAETLKIMNDALSPQGQVEASKAEWSKQLKYGDSNKAEVKDSGLDDALKPRDWTANFVMSASNTTLTVQAKASASH